MFGFLPPSSSASFLKLPLAAFITAAPASAPPVNDSRSTSRWRASSAPASPEPVTRLNTPGGKADVDQQFGQAVRAQRRQFARLEHHRVARAQRWRELPGGLQQRV